MKKFSESAEIFMAAFFVMLLVYTYFFRVFTVSGDSMRDTLKSGDMVVTLFMYGEPERGDIVVANTGDENGTIIKRVIATGGQTIDINFGSGAVFVDGERLFEDYLTLGLTHRDEGAFDYPVTVPDGFVFVMGDNRSVSEDSRSEKIGFLPVENIIGKVIYRFGRTEG